ncbi:hypothetical protein MASR2M29_11790 [Spirochaetota bacterium]
MNPYALTALVLLAIAASGQYFFGSKKNRAISSRLSRDLEDSLKPQTTNYVNIGGTIGYNFAYSMTVPWSKAKGTFTVNARHSLLYLPLSLLFGIRDRFYMNLFTKKKLSGEGHIVSAAYLRKANIDGIDSMKKTEVFQSGKKFFLLYKLPEMEKSLKELLDSMPEPVRLRHFCIYPETKTFFIYYLPRQGKLKPLLDTLLPQLPNWFDGREE